MRLERRRQIERLILADRDSYLNVLIRQAGLFTWPDIAAELLGEIDTLERARKESR